MELQSLPMVRADLVAWSDQFAILHGERLHVPVPSRQSIDACRHLDEPTAGPSLIGAYHERAGG